jgi:hypothetical protein
MKAIVEQNEGFPIFAARNADKRSAAMSKSSIFMFARKWNGWYRILRHGKGFGPLDSMRYGLWLTRGCA